MPEQEISVDVQKEDNSIISIEPWEKNENVDWPEAQIQKVVNGKINLCNSSNKPIVLGKDVKYCQVRDTHETGNDPPSSDYEYSPSSNQKIK